MIRIAILGAVALLAGCDQAERQAGADAASVQGCQVVATQTWRDFSVEAASAGPNCENAVATLTIRDAQRSVMWTEAFPTAQVMVLAQARDPEAMQTAMAEWIDTSNNAMTTTGALPDWPAGADGPQSGEFPFYPLEVMTRDDYVVLRQRNLPMFCYVQGMESEACLALEEGGFTKVGVQSFPG